MVLLLVASLLSLFIVAIVAGDYQHQHDDDAYRDGDGRD